MFVDNAKSLNDNQEEYWQNFTTREKVFSICESCSKSVVKVLRTFRVCIWHAEFLDLKKKTFGIRCALMNDVMLLQK